MCILEEPGTILGTPMLSGTGTEPVTEKWQALKEMAAPACAKGVKDLLWDL